MKHALAVLITGALLFCACVPNAGAVEAVEVALPTPIPTPVPTPTPVPSPTPTPSPTHRPSAWYGIDDNGVDGVGTVRGNTNGNYALSSCEVSDGTVACYARITEKLEDHNYRWTITCRDLATGKDAVLVSGVTQYGDADSLNLYQGYLYYEADGVWRVPITGGEPELVRERGLNVLVVYDLICITGMINSGDTRENGLNILDANTLRTRYTYPDTWLLGAMDGRLYCKSIATDNLFRCIRTAVACAATIAAIGTERCRAAGIYS